MKNTETITWIPLAKQKPNPTGNHKGHYLVTFSDGTVGFDSWSPQWKDFHKSGARDPKTGNRDYDEFAIAWAEPLKGYVER